MSNPHAIIALVGIITRASILKLVLQSVQLVNVVLVINALSVSEYGLYASAVVLIMSAGVIGSRGLEGAVVAIVRQCSLDASQTRAVSATAVWLAMKFTLPTAACLLIIFLVNIEFANFDIKHILVCVFSIGLLPFIIAARRILDSVMVCAESPAKILCVQLIAELIRTFILLLGLVFDGGFFTTVFAFITCTFVNFIVIYYYTFFGLTSYIRLSCSQELKAQTTPLIPGIIFSNFQINILMIIALFFVEIETLASIAVASRFAFFFSFLQSIANYVLLPKLASPMSLRLFERRVMFMSVLFITCATAIAVAIHFAFDWIIAVIGDEYRIIEDLLWVVLATHAFTALASLLWVVQVARKWVWPWMPYVSIPLTVMLQVWMLFNLDVSALEGAIWFGFGSALIAIAVRLFMLAYGILFFEKHTRFG